MKITIAEDFSFAPGPRFEREGDFSGEMFRNQILRKALIDAIKNKEILTVDLDGTAGYGRSFLEESFGGLIREDGLDYEEIRKYLKIISTEEEYLEDKVYKYLEEANAAKR